MAIEDLTPHVAESAKNPKKAASDNTMFESHSLSEKIEADKYLKSQCATGSGKKGFKLTRLIPPGIE